MEDLYCNLEQLLNFIWFSRQLLLMNAVLEGLL